MASFLAYAVDDPLPPNVFGALIEHSRVTFADEVVAQIDHHEFVGHDSVLLASLASGAGAQPDYCIKELVAATRSFPMADLAANEPPRFERNHGTTEVAA